MGEGDNATTGWREGGANEKERMYIIGKTDNVNKWGGRRLERGANEQERIYVIGEGDSELEGGEGDREENRDA